MGKFKDEFSSMLYQQAKLDQSILEHVDDRSEKTEVYIEQLPPLKLKIIKEIAENRKVSQESLSFLYKITDILGTAARKKAREKREKVRRKKKIMRIIGKELEELEDAKLALIHASDPPPPDDIPTIMRFSNTYDFYLDILFKAIGDHSEYTEEFFLEQSEKALYRRSGDMLSHTIESNQFKNSKK